MRSPAAQILETALALQRAPGERFRLRERPLPPGIVHAIEAAADSPAIVKAAAGELGESEGTLVEAARFYLEQVLFADPHADAYRVLGLSSDATPEDIRTHHRWLQRWLHPDRAQAGDASVFATRVNQAFSQLRSPESRQAYDVKLAEARLAGASAPLPPETVHRWGHMDDEAPRHGRRSRWLLGAALASCLVLAVLIVRNPDREAPWNPGGGGEEILARQKARPAIDDRDFGVLGAALAEPNAPLDDQAPLDDHPVDVTPPPAEDRFPLAPTSTRPPSDPPRVASARHTAPAQEAPAPVVAQAPAPPPAQPMLPETASPPDTAMPKALQPASRPDPEDAALVVARFPLARERVAEVTGYLVSLPRAVPLWDSVQALAETNEARHRLNANNGTALELAGPVWRMWPDRATFNVSYSCRPATGASCGGRLEVLLVWREGLWLVRSVTVEPSA